MRNNLATVFTPDNLSKVFTAVFKVNKKTGARTAKIVFSNGTMRTQTVTKTGVKIATEYILPVMKTTADKIPVAKDLYKIGMKQVDIADLFHVSQPTISTWLKK